MREPAHSGEYRSFKRLWTSFKVDFQSADLEVRRWEGAFEEFPQMTRLCAHIPEKGRQPFPQRLAYGKGSYSNCLPAL